MKSTYLEDILRLLEQNGFTCQHFEQSKDIVSDHIFVKMTDDEKRRARSLTISLSENDFGEKMPAYFLKIFMPFPVEVPTEREEALAFLVCRCNQTADIPGFGAYGTKPYYRYDLYYPRGSPEKVLVGVLGLIYLYADAYGPLFDQLCKESPSD